MNPKTNRKTPKLTKNNYNNGSSKFLICCRPQAIDIKMNNVVSVKPVHGCTDGSSEPVFTYVKAVEEKLGVVLTRVLPAAASLCGDDDENISIEDKNILQHMKNTKKNKRNHLRLLGILKAVFSETSVARKIRKRKYNQKMCQSNGNENSLLKESSGVDNGSCVSNTSSSPLSSSMITTISSPCSSLKSSSDTNKSFRLASTIERKPTRDAVQVQPQHGKGCYGPNVGLCFILISLLILILWGKLCAVVCTSTWLFFGARWKIGNRSSETVPVNSPRLDSEEHKKNIIMEGLLERDYSRRL